MATTKRETCKRCGRRIGIVHGVFVPHMMIEHGTYSALQCTASGKRPEDLIGLSLADIDAEASAIAETLARYERQYVEGDPAYQSEGAKLLRRVMYRSKGEPIYGRTAE